MTKNGAPFGFNTPAHYWFTLTYIEVMNVIEHQLCVRKCKINAILYRIRAGCIRNLACIVQKVFLYSTIAYIGHLKCQNSCCLLNAESILFLNKSRDN